MAYAMTHLINRTAAVTALVNWYRSTHRPLPWRQTRDPYHIWVSETMLQQTQVATVIPYYHAFLMDFPTVVHLAEADEQAVLKRWQGLGYYSRARNLHKGAQVVVAKHGGVIPRDPEQFEDLPGVGPYTRGAVMSIAFDLPEPAVDGNVYRVMSRLFGIEQAIDSTAVKRAVADETAQWVRLEKPGDVTQALMELGAVLCTPKSADCDRCPLVELCYAYQHGAVAEFPVRLQKRSRRVFDVAAVWLELDDALLLEQRRAGGLLAEMWQLPSIELERVDGLSVPVAVMTEAVRQRFDLYSTETGELTESAWVEAACAMETTPPYGNAQRGTLDFAEIASLKHVFTHVEWHVHVYRPVGYSAKNRASLVGDDVLYREGRLQWVPRAQVQQLPIPRVFERLFQEVGLLHDAEQGRLEL